MLIFFSGGVDSAALAFDAARYPHRYGVAEPASQVLHLLSYTYDNPDTKARQLRALVRAVSKVACFQRVEHHVKQCDLKARAPKTPTSWQTLHPALHGFNRECMPYTPGLHLWLASWAMNILADSMPSNEFTPEQALFGFQDDGPLWERQDAGELEPTDASPEFMSTLNELVEASGGTIWFRAPFLDLRLNKLMVFKLALDVGVPLEATSSCIQGWMSKCGVCPQCMTRAAAARALGVSE